MPRWAVRAIAHLYQLVFGPIEGNANLFVDGFGSATLSDGGRVDDSYFFSSLIDARHYPAFDLEVTDLPYDVYAYHQGGAPTSQSRVARFSLGASSLDGFRRARVSGFQIVRVAQVPEPKAAIAPLLAGLWVLTRRSRPRMEGNPAIAVT